MKLCELKKNLLQDLSNFKGDFGVTIFFGNSIRSIYGTTEEMDEFEDELDCEFLIFSNHSDVNFSYKIKDRNDVTHENFMGKVVFSRS